MAGMNGLPLRDVARALAENGAAVLTAPPGSGKTTIVPPALLREEWLADGKTVILEPRRLAARLAARRLAENLGCRLGEEVGLAVRFESRASAATRILVVTEGVMVRMLQDDPELSGVGLVVFDEFHERSLEADLALALCLDVKENLRPDLRLLFMSATLDCAGLGRFLACPVTSGGRQPHPVEKIHISPPGRDAGDFHRYHFGRTVERAAAAVLRAVKENAGDILVFLPGVGEIKKCAALLAQRLKEPGFAVLPLYGDLPRSRQDMAIRPLADKRRIILATPVAETSITIEGVTTVVDSGFARRPRFDPGRGMGGLHTARISRAEAEQRAGRAGRTGPGVCYRLWPESHHGALAPAPPLAIRNADLAGLALELLRWGVRGPGELSWLDAPPQESFARALDLLERLGFAKDGRLTEKGRRAAELPVHPRLAAMILAGEELGCAEEACRMAAMLSGRDLFAASATRTADLEKRTEALAAFEKGGRFPGDRAAAERIMKTARQLLARCRAAPGKGQVTADVLLAAAWPERIAALRPGSRSSYILAGGGGAELPEDDPLCGGEFLVVAELALAPGGHGRIRLAVPADISRLQQRLPRLFKREERIFFDRQGERVRAVEELRCGAVVCASAPAGDPDPEECLAVLARAVRELSGLEFGRRARSLQARVLAARRFDPGGGWPDVGDAALYESLEQWLPLWAPGARSIAETKKIDMAAVIDAMLGQDQRRRLAREVPETITTPAGTKARLRYPEEGPPVMEVRIQEMFGCETTPAVMGGRVPVLLHLMTPAMRPAQVTGDLESFWKNVYPQVKKELAGRYPKHPWPADPLKARPWRPGGKKNGQGRGENPPAAAR